MMGLFASIRFYLAVLPLLLIAPPVLAQASNFGSVTLSAAAPNGVSRGTTGGSTSLPAIIGNNDRNNNKCLGFGDPNPDHILVLKDHFARLTLQVSANSPDMTLVVAGPDGVVRCGDNIGSRSSINLTDADWKPGEYRIWVGTMVPNVRRSYTFNVRVNSAP